MRNREERGSFALKQPSTYQIEAVAVWRSMLGGLSLLNNTVKEKHNIRR